MAAPMVNTSNLFFQSRVFRLRCSSFFRRVISTIAKSGSLQIDPILTSHNETIKYRQHPGIINQRTIVVPERLEKAFTKLMNEYPIPSYKENAKKLVNYLQSRHTPTETEDLRKIALEIESKIPNDKLKAAEEDEEALQRELDRRKNIVRKKLRRQIYHWQPIEYDATKSMTYMMARMVLEYSVLFQIFSEIKKRQKCFIPRTMFDFGSGVGSVTWAANQVWPQDIYEHYCVDHSADMNTLSRLLFQDGEERKEPWVKGLFQRQFFPRSHENKYSLVCSAYSLFELPNRHERRNKIIDLWKKTDTNGFMVLVENGSSAGFHLILEARKIILNTIRNSEDETLFGNIFAPCPHQYTCPITTQLKSPCNFEMRVKPNPSLAVDVQGLHRFSYIVFRKGKPTNEDTLWPRIIRPVSKPSRHVHCRICATNGKLEHHVLTARLNGSDLYKCARRSECGDLLPAVDVTTQGEVKEEKSEESQPVADSLPETPSREAQQIIEQRDVGTHIEEEHDLHPNMSS